MNIHLDHQQMLAYLDGELSRLENHSGSQRCCSVAKYLPERREVHRLNNTGADYLLYEVSYGGIGNYVLNLVERDQVYRLLSHLQ
jgi:hypothetical protein